MDAIKYYNLRGTLGEHVTRIMAQRNLTCAAIRSFALCFEKQLDREGNLVKVGWGQNDQFAEGQFNPNLDGSVDFVLKLRFNCGEGILIDASAHMRAHLIAEQKIIRWTSIQTGESVDVAYPPTMVEESFVPVYALLDAGITKSAFECLQEI